MDLEQNILHCPPNNLNLGIKTKPVTYICKADATVYTYLSKSGHIPLHPLDASEYYGHWEHFCTYIYIQYYDTASWLFFMVAAVGIRSDTAGAFSHTSPRGVEPATFEILSVSYTSTRFNRLRDIHTPQVMVTCSACHTHFLYIMYRGVRFNWNICPLQDLNPNPPDLDSQKLGLQESATCSAPSNLLVHDLKAEGPLSDRCPTIQLEVSQSAVVKPWFERG